MRIIRVSSHLYDEVESDDPEQFSYRRFGPDTWEKGYGSSWEEVYDCHELEEAYQAFIRGTTYV